jgi:carboxypeptidase C (cathepsin A)
MYYWAYILHRNNSDRYVRLILNAFLISQTTNNCMLVFSRIKKLPTLQTIPNHIFKTENTLQHVQWAQWKSPESLLCHDFITKDLIVSHDEFLLCVRLQHHEQNILFVQEIIPFLRNWRSKVASGDRLKLLYLYVSYICLKRAFH